MPSCGDCGKGFSSGGCSGIHAARWNGSCHDTFNYDCSNCMEVCNTKNRRKSHMNRQHTGATCGQCEKPFYDETRRDQHQKAKDHNTGTKQANQQESHANNVNESLSGNHPEAKESHAGSKVEAATAKPFNINRQARYFHDKHARCSNPQKNDQSFAAFREVSAAITDQLKEKGLISRREFAGSTWERTNIPGSSDFDVLLVNRDDKDNVKVMKGQDVPKGYANLVKDDETLTPSATLNATKSNIQKIINKHDFGNYDVKMRSHGPAVQIDVSRKQGKTPLASIDLVPTLEKPDGQMFVAKSFKLGPTDGDVHWRISHSLTAKEKLLSADSGNGCRREVYRTCKVLRNAEPNLSHLTSYQLKTALFNAMDNHNTDAEWSRDKIGDGVIRVISALRDSYKAQTLPDYYEPGIDLIEKVKEDTAANTANRLNYLINHPEKLFPPED